MSLVKSIAICQARPVAGDVASSARIIILWMEKASAAGADIALFGELFLSDYDLDNVSTLSISKHDEVIKDISKAAKRLKIAVAFGYSEVDGSQYYDSLMFIDGDGTVMGNYRKVHVWPGTEDHHYQAGKQSVVVNWGGVKVGLAICVDVCMSEFVSSMVVNDGADIIVVASALVDGPRYRKTPEVIVPTRALENRCFIAYLDLAGDKYNGVSRVCDPFGQCVVSASTTEEVLLLCNISLPPKDVPFRYHSLRRPSLQVRPYETEIPWNIEGDADVENFFNHRAHYYDEQMDGIYNGPKIAAQELTKVVLKKDKKLLDVAAGTGLVGKALFDMGFTDITALDRNEQMLKHAASKHVYKEIIQGSFGEKTKALADNSFYASVCVGAFLTSGFLDPFVTVKEMIRLTEIGGIILILVNSTELSEPNGVAIMQNLEGAVCEAKEKNLCDLVTKATVPKYLEECEGVVWVLRKRE